MEFDLSLSVPLLAQTPGTLRHWLGALPDPWIRATEGPDTWSPFDVMGHLLHGERTDWIPRMRIILAQGASREFAPFDRFAQFRTSEGKSLAQLLDEFAEARAASLAELQGWRLTDAQLELRGVHPAFGEVTLRQLLATWVVHDLTHISQVARVLALQYGDAVGPWKAYLSVLSR